VNLAIITIDYRYNCSNLNGTDLLECPPATTPVYVPD